MKKILYVVIVVGFSILPFQASAECSSTPAGYTLLGELNDHRYYLSDGNFNHAQASAQAASLGGYMASITDAAENDFLRSRINKIVRIGLSDDQSEGSLGWDSGEALQFNNVGNSNDDENDFANMNFWNGGWELEGKFVARPYILEIECGDGSSNPADLTISNVDIVSSVNAGDTFELRFRVPNIGGTAVTNVYGVDVRLSTDGVVSGDDTLLLQRDVQADLAPGQQLLINETVTLPANRAAGNYTLIIRVDPTQNIAEISDNNNQLNQAIEVTTDGGGPAECPDSLTGYSSMGTLNDHAYFLSDDRQNWNTASNLADQAGGYLASIGSQTENEFLKNNINEISLIGLNDAASEGNLQWDSGEALGYQNITGSNSDAGDFANMNFWNGGWDFDNAQVARRYIVEIECGDTGGADLPDLSLSNLGNLGSGAAGSVVQFTFDLNNSGLAIASESYRIGMFLTSNGIIQNGDPLVGEIPTGNTPLGTIANITGAITIPANTAPGNYVLVLVADSDDVVTESNESNNNLAASLLVNDGGPAQCGFETNLGAHPAGTNIASEKVTDTGNGFLVEAFNTVQFPASSEVTNYTLNQQGSLTSQQGPFTVQPSAPNLTPNGDQLSVSDLLSDNQTVIFERKRPDGSTVFSSNVFINHGGQTISGIGITQLADGFLLSGRPISSGPPNSAPFFIRTDSTGNKLWQATLPADDGCRSYSTLDESVDGKILILENNFCLRGASLIQLSSNGNIDWTQGFIGDLVSSRIGNSTYSLDGQFIYQTNFFDPQVKATKRNAANGEVVWSHSLDSLFSPLSEFNRSNRDDKAIILTSDGGIVVGHGYSTPGSLVEGSGYEFGKINADGEMVWFKRLEGDLRLIPQFETSDGGLLFVQKNQQIFSNSDAGDLVILKLNSDGSPAPDCRQSNLNLPDFRSSFRSVSLAVGNGNRSFDIDLSMQANGVGQVDVPTLFVISSDEIVDAQDIRLRDEANATFFITPGSQANISQNTSLSLSFPENTPSGNYFLIAVHDPLGTIDESNESNNITVSSQTFSVNPVIGNVDVGTGFSNISPRSAFPSGSPTTFFDVNVPTKPNGSGNSFTYDVAYYLSTDNVLSADDVGFVEPNINSIFRPSTAPAGNSPSQLFARLVVPQGTAPGNYFLIVSHDPNNEIAETDENNNVHVSSQSFPIGITNNDTIDLELDVSVDRTQLEKFQNYTFTMVLSNNGSVTATDIRVRFNDLRGILAFVDASASKGDHQGWNFLWRDFDLAPGTSATATITYFTLIDDDQITFSADVEAHAQEDVDSTPGNGFNAGEDDDDSATIFPQ